jgi:Flp pilus assembly protein TadD
MRLANTLIEDEDVEEAAREYKAGLKLQPNNPTAHDGLGDIALRKEDYETAGREYGKCLDLDPDSADCHFGLAIALQDRKNPDNQGALHHLRRAVEAFPKNAQARNRLGAVLDELDDQPGALDAYRNAHELDPNDKTYLANYKQTLKNLGK